MNIDGAQLTTVTDVSKGKDGRLLACGHSMDREGRAAPFLAFVNAATSTAQIVRTGSFNPKLVALASDGSAWAAGPDFTDEGRVVNAHATMIRHFSPDGKELGGFVEQQTVKHRRDLSDPRNRLIEHDGDIYWFSPGDQRLIAVSTEGVKKDIDGITLPDEAWRTEGLAVVGPGEIFLATAGTKSTRVWSFDESGRMFRAVPTVGNVGILYGSDARRLVFSVPEDWSSIRIQEIR